jgi:DNA-binding NarL/FixJ family response regulator
MIKIGIVDDHAIVRSGLRQYLTEHVDLRVTGEASNGREAMELARGGDIDVMLMDISMPDQSGVDALAAIKARFPALHILILSGFPEAHYAKALLRQGASGYLNKDCYISPALSELLADNAAGGSNDRLAHDQLSDREFQVFLQLAKGETISHMAQGMFLSVKTVSTYRARVLDKLKLSSNSDLTYYALKNGLIQ